MATYYVYSGASGSGTGADWANAFTTLSAALSGKAAGDIFYVAHDHAESQSSTMTLTFPGTFTSPNRVICVDRGGTVPPVAADIRATATITTTTTANIAFASGTVYIEGITFSAASGANSFGIQISTSGGGFIFKNCALRKASTSGGVTQIGATSSNSSCVVFDNTTVQFGNTGDGLNARNVFFIWRNTASAITGATIPTTLFSASSSSLSVVTLEGVDLSAMTSGTIFGIGVAQSYLKDCKLNAGVTISAAYQAVGGGVASWTRASSAGNVTYGYRDSHGVSNIETTIVRTGGATDGTTAFAQKIDTVSQTSVITPFRSAPMAVWNNTEASAVTVTVYGIWGGGAVPNNDEFWIEAVYLGDASSPQGSRVSSGPATVLTAGSALTSDTSTWGGSTTKFRTSVTFTPQQKGFVYVYVVAAKASSTFYYDPKPVLS